MCEYVARDRSRTHRINLNRQSNEKKKKKLKPELVEPANECQSSRFYPPKWKRFMQMNLDLNAVCRHELEEHMRET